MHEHIRTCAQMCRRIPTNKYASCLHVILFHACISKFCIDAYHTYETYINAYMVTDEDECASGIHTCSANSVCTNFLGGFTCACSGQGYVGNGTQCMQASSAQGSSLVCRSVSEAPYACVCAAGVTSCRDIDECDFTTCPENSECLNHVGSFECRSRHAYVAPKAIAFIHAAALCIQYFISNIFNCLSFANLISTSSTRAYALGKRLTSRAY